MTASLTSTRRATATNKARRSQTSRLTFGDSVCTSLADTVVVVVVVDDDDVVAVPLPPPSQASF